MTNATKGKVIKGAAVTLDVAAPLIATLSQFPVWVERSSDATVSGLFLIFALLSILPFLKAIKEYFKSPSVWVIWIICFVFFVVMRNIIDEMLIVSFIGAVANIVGAGIYKVGKKVRSEEHNV
jgi:hypothetical protein